MFGKYFVTTIILNMSNNVSQSIEAYDTKKQAEDKFYDKLSSVGGNPQTKKMRVLLLNSDGMQYKDEIRDNTEVEPAEEA